MKGGEEAELRWPLSEPVCPYREHLGVSGQQSQLVGGGRCIRGKAPMVRPQVAPRLAVVGGLPRMHVEAMIPGCPGEGRRTHGPEAHNGGKEPPIASELLHAFPLPDPPPSFKALARYPCDGPPA